MPSVTLAGVKKPCCQEDANLVETQPRYDLIIQTCRVCGCRHFRVLAEKGALGATLKGLGTS